MNVENNEKSGKVLIVIPCLNEEKHLESVVMGVVDNNIDLPLHIVIADGGSTDKTAEIAQNLVQRYPSITYLLNPKRLQSAAVNLAVARFGDEADFFIRMDAHAGYSADFVRVLIEEAKETKADSVVIGMNTVGTTFFQQAVAAAQNSKLGNGGSAHRLVTGEGKWVDHGHHALMRVAAFRAVGGYDESFSHNEDAELDVRLRKQGHKIWLTGKTVMDYYPRSAVKPLFKQYFNFGKGRARTVFKHRQIPKLRQLAPLAVAPAAGLALLSPLFYLALAPVALWALLCLIYGLRLGVRAHSLAVAFSGSAAMVMHFAWSLGFWYAFGTLFFKGAKNDV